MESAETTDVSSDEVEILSMGSSGSEQPASDTLPQIGVLKGGPYYRPPLSYACLTYLAFKNTIASRIRVSQIYNFVMKHFPYYTSISPRGWKNSIRHNLSMNRNFTKVSQIEFDYTDRHCTWSLTPERLEKMDHEMRQQTKKHWIFVTSRCMKCPKDLVYIVEGLANNAKPRCMLPPKEMVDYTLPGNPSCRSNTDIKFTQLETTDKRLGVVLFSKTIPLPSDFFTKDYSLFPEDFI